MLGTGPWYGAWHVVGSQERWASIGLSSSLRLWPACRLQRIITSRMKRTGRRSPGLRHIARGQRNLAGAGVTQGPVVLEPHDSGRRVGLEHHLQCPAAVKLRELYRVQLSQQPHVTALCKGRPSGAGLCPASNGAAAPGGGASGFRN